MSSKARGLADLGNAFDDGALSNRNLIINGAMQVAQRGTSQTTTGYGSIDRMILSLSGATATMTQETLALGQTDLPSQFRKFARIATTTGNNNCGLLHRIEDVDTAEGEVTLSFYAKGTNPASGSFNVFLYQGFGSGGSAGVSTTAQSLTLTSSWQRFEFVFTLASLSGKTIGTGSNLEIDIVQPDADTGTSAWTLDITGVQLELGDGPATPFEHRSYSDQLQACKRYYQQKNDSGNALASGIWYSASQVLAYGKFDTTMRAAPTITVSSGDFAKCYTRGTSRDTLDSSPCDNIDVNETRYNLTVGVSGTQGDGTHVQLNSSEAIYFDAEL